MVTRFIAIVALCVALGAAFGQRSDYLRLEKMMAPQVSVMEIFHGIRE